MGFDQENQQRISKIRRSWLRKYHRHAKAWRQMYGDYIPVPLWPPQPAEIVGLPCGARTRAGAACRRKGMYPSGRCVLHGGRSTGPKTLKGKYRSMCNHLRRKPRLRIAAGDDTPAA
jgi:hypothetical protein